MMRPLIAIVGPTASGKSELAMKLCARVGGEIVSADSVQIYRRFDIGSAKPTPAERARVPHHLIDRLDPLEAVDAARFVQLADECIADILARGKRPVLCGGSFLWLRAVLYGLAEAPPADPGIRARHKSLAEQFGRAHLHEQLRTIDAPSHARLSPNDLIRVSRALEVHELTGQPLSLIQAQHGFRTLRYPVLLVGVRHERAALYTRIQERVLHMFEQGWLDEVRALLEDGFGSARALGAVGYRQVREALRAGEPIDVPSLIEKVAQATRQFVRHQLTWLRDEPVRWLAPAEACQPDSLDLDEARNDGAGFADTRL
jgi:tRNA dimethylallyltransferase